MTYFQKRSEEHPDMVYGSNSGLRLKRGPLRHPARIVQEVVKSNPGRATLQDGEYVPPEADRAEGIVLQKYKVPAAGIAQDAAVFGGIGAAAGGALGLVGRLAGKSAKKFGVAGAAVGTLAGALYGGLTAASPDYRGFAFEDAPYGKSDPNTEITPITPRVAREIRQEIADYALASGTSLEEIANNPGIFEYGTQYEMPNGPPNTQWHTVEATRRLNKDHKPRRQNVGSFAATQRRIPYSTYLANRAVEANLPLLAKDDLQKKKDVLTYREDYRNDPSTDPNDPGTDHLRLWQTPRSWKAPRG